VSETNPVGMSWFELRELAGHPHAWEEPEEILVTERRIAGAADWVVRSRFLVGPRDVYLVELQVEPASLYPWPPPTPLNTEVIRSIHPAELVRYAKRVLANGQVVDVGLSTEAAEFRSNPRPGKVGRPDIFYARVAAKYVGLRETSSSPTKDLAVYLYVSQSQARDLIHEARHRRLLTKTKRGVAGGELTPKARDLLAALGDEEIPPGAGVREERSPSRGASTTPKGRSSTRRGP